MKDRKGFERAGREESRRRQAELEAQKGNPNFRRSSKEEEGEEMSYEYGDTIVEIDGGWVKDYGYDIEIVFVDTTTDTLHISKDNLPRLIQMLRDAQSKLDKTVKL